MAESILHMVTIKFDRPLPQGVLGQLHGRLWALGRQVTPNESQRPQCVVVQDHMKPGSHRRQFTGSGLACIGTGRFVVGATHPHMTLEWVAIDAAQARMFTRLSRRVIAKALAPHMRSFTVE